MDDRRKNPTEQMMVDAIKEVFPNVHIFPKDNSFRAMEIRKGYYPDEPILFYNAECDWLTPTGENHKVELYFHYKEYGTYFEVKHQDTYSNTADTPMIEMLRAERQAERYQVIYEGKGFNKGIIINDYDAFIEQKERVTYSLGIEEFKTNLIKLKERLQ